MCAINFDLHLKLRNLFETFDAITINTLTTYFDMSAALKHEIDHDISYEEKNGRYSINNKTNLNLSLS